MSSTPKRTFRISDANYEALKTIAANKGITLTEYINWLFADAVMTHGMDWQQVRREGRPKKDTP